VDRWEGAIESRWATPVALTALTALSLFIRNPAARRRILDRRRASRSGSAHHHWSSIPSLLHQDGSPPAYYMLLGLWIRVFGDTERATHTLSLLFGLACIRLHTPPARSLFDRTTGLVCAVLAALDPFLTYYAQETRMYELEAFLSLVIAYAYVQASCAGAGSGGAARFRPWRCFSTRTTGGSLCVSPWRPRRSPSRASASSCSGLSRSRGAPLHPLAPDPVLPVEAHRGALVDRADRPRPRDGADVGLRREGPYYALALVCGAALAAVVRSRGSEERRIVLALLTIMLWRLRPPSSRPSSPPPGRCVTSRSCSARRCSSPRAASYAHSGSGS